MTKESVADIVVSGGSVSLDRRSRTLLITDVSNTVHSRKNGKGKRYQVDYRAPEGDKTAEALNGSKLKRKPKDGQMKSFTYPDEFNSNVFSHLYDDVDIAADKFMLIYSLEFSK